MKNKLITVDNYLFIASAIISGFICYGLLGPANVTLGIVSIMFTFIIYSAKPNNGDYLYTFMWSALIITGCYIGIGLKLSLGFYLFLFLVSNYYYITFNRDPFSDRAIPFMVIYASLGTTIPELDEKSAISYFIGTTIALIILGVAHKNKIQFSAFRTGLFSKALYKNPPHTVYSAIIYSSLLFLCLFLPEHIGMSRAYWAPMTFIVLLKPKEDKTIKNTADRFLGSVLGAVLVLILLNIEGIHRGINFAIIAVFVFFLPTFLKMPRLLKTFGMTAFILLLLESTEFGKNPSYTLPYTRIFETFIGGSLAIVGSLLLRFLKKHSKLFS